MGTYLEMLKGSKLSIERDLPRLHKPLRRGWQDDSLDMALKGHQLGFRVRGSGIRI